MKETTQSPQAYLIGVISPERRRWLANESLDELKSLARTAGLSLVGEEIVEVRRIIPATFLGSGTVDRIELRIEADRVDVVILDIDLSPTQNRNLEERWGIPVIDRTSLILDIFALHATSKEGKLQVELAQYEYLYPRLVGAWTHLSKQRGGGVGLRGPGETQLEVDRRRAREKMTRIKQALIRVSKAREIHRRKRAKVPIPTVTLVGYTNAGKSTLFNVLASGRQWAEDQLFATLDPKTQKIQLPSGRQILLTDTVGFIRNLPHQLVEAFKSTFEEARDSDLLLHVVDAANLHFQHQIEVVEQVLKELGLHTIPRLLLMNKMDGISQSQPQSAREAIPISAKTGEGLDPLLRLIDGALADQLTPVTLFIPHDQGQHLTHLYRHGHVYQINHEDDGIRIQLALPEKWLQKYRRFAVV